MSMLPPMGTRSAGPSFWTDSMTTQKTVEVPAGWPGSEATYIAYEALLRAGRQPGRDFTYQSATQGRRLESDLDVDFMFTNPPALAMQVQEGLYSHSSGIETRGRDILTKAQLAGSGVMLVLLDHDKLRQDPDWLIGEALQYRDHSWG